MPRFKDANWELPVGDGGKIRTWEHAHLAVLMDIRDELKQLNQTLGCYNLRRMALAIQRIDRRLAKKLPLRPGRPKPG